MSNGYSGFVPDWGASGNILKSDGTKWISSSSIDIKSLDMGAAQYTIPWPVGVTPDPALGHAYYKSDTKQLLIGDGVTANPVSGGSSGYSGYSGRSGYSGVGILGISGYSGYSGRSGFSGLNGIATASGYSGYSGVGGLGVSGYSGKGGSNFVHNQVVNSTTWIINHNLGMREVLVQVFNSTGNQIIPQSVVWGTANQCIISLSTATIGTAVVSSGGGVSGFSGYSALGGSGTGISGYSGYSGPQGFMGVPGAGGQSGFSGWSGKDGQLGISGFSGPQGGTGIQGYSGFSGYSGPQGFVGYGISGYSGKDGQASASGYSGFSGLGVSGWSGFSGLTGPQGVPGTTGVGVSGLSGYSGASGTGGGTSRYLSTRFTSSSVVTVSHNFGVIPNVVVVRDRTDGKWDVINPRLIVHSNFNQVTVTLQWSVTGYVICNA